MSSDSERIEKLESELEQIREVMFQMAKLAELGKLVAVVAHELSQPLLGIKAFAQILQRRYRDDEFVGPKIGIIVQQAHVMEGIIDSLRQYSRQKQIEPGGVDLEQVINTALELFQDRSRKRKVKVSTELAKHLPRVSVNRGHLQQVVVNLISNALDELEGTQAGMVLVRAAEEGDRVVVLIADTGAGVPDSIRDKLFEPFFTTKGEEKGTGLGLAICRDILKVHGGSIRLLDPDEVAAAFGDSYGAAFEVGLPVFVSEEDGDGPDGA